MSEFSIIARDAGSRARAGALRTAHGEVRTPAFDAARAQPLKSLLRELLRTVAGRHRS